MYPFEFFFKYSLWILPKILQKRIIQKFGDGDSFRGGDSNQEQEVRFHGDWWEHCKYAGSIYIVRRR